MLKRIIVVSLIAAFALMIMAVMADYIMVPQLEAIITNVSMGQMENTNGVIQSINFYKGLIFIIEWILRPLSVAGAIVCIIVAIVFKDE